MAFPSAGSLGDFVPGADISADSSGSDGDCENPLSKDDEKAPKATKVPPSYQIPAFSFRSKDSIDTSLRKHVVALLKANVHIWHHVTWAKLWQDGDGPIACIVQAL